MTAPIPRPPGPWRALARDAILTPQEAAARDAALAELQDKGVTAPAVPAVSETPPHQRLTRIQSLADRSGWRVNLLRTAERARIEAFHPDGAAVMATAVPDRSVHAYVLHPAGQRTPRWLATTPSAAEYFIEHLRLPEGAARRKPDSKCRCKKAGRFPTQAWAQRALTNILINKELRQGRRATERRVYRCPADDRVWHITSRRAWHPDNRSPR
ncbi:MAG TPA: hypothetical protein VI172_15610 [Candidatus Dormibacteraeota bacterium]